MFSDVREGLFLMVYRTFKYNDAITCMCLTYHSHSISHTCDPASSDDVTTKQH